MSFITGMLRYKRGKSDLHALFMIAAIGQALALIVGLWLEQKLQDSSAAWTASHNPNHQIETSNETDFQVYNVNSSARERVASTSETFTIKLIVFLWTFSSQAVIAYLLLSRWNTIRVRQQAADANTFARQNHDLVRTRDAVIFGLAKLAESRDPDTGHHLERIALYTTRLAEAMRQQSPFASEITPAFLKLLGVSSALHDIGKVGVEDSILLKPGRLTESERRKIERHTIVGSDCIEQIAKRLGASNFLEMAQEIALNHHERWDGTGYPNGLSGESIPLPARIIAVADVYDALSARRVYKKAYPHEKCVRIIQEGAGSQFDPRIVEIFVQIEAEFRKYAEEMSDQIIDDDSIEQSETAVMTSEQEQFLARLIASEKYCTVDTLLEPAQRGSRPEFAESPESFSRSISEE